MGDIERYPSVELVREVIDGGGSLVTNGRMREFYAALAEADSLRQQLKGAVGERDRWRDCARKLYAKWQAGEQPPSESALGRLGFQMREPRQ